jgi:hypothetical protein
MENYLKKDEEILAEIYRNAQLAIQSIVDILPEVENEEIRTEILREHEIYEDISARASMLARDKGIELKEPNPFKKAMMWGSIKMSTLTDNSRSHIAEMMIRGTVMGITALKSSENDAGDSADPDIMRLLREFIQTEERFEEILKKYL